MERLCDAAQPFRPSARLLTRRRVGSYREGMKLPRRLESGWREGKQLIAAHSSAEIAPKPAGG